MATTDYITLDEALAGRHRPVRVEDPVTRATETSPILAVSQYQGRFVVAVVGAGGNGARLLPPLTQMLRDGDEVLIFDHDIVEDRNLRRQHFAPRDIGQPKALVLAQRYSKPQVPVTAFATKLSRDTERTIRASINERDEERAVLLVGCVDNAEARAVLCLLAGNLSEYGACAYVDCGNEMRGGQVLLDFTYWPLLVKAAGREQSGSFNMQTLAEAMPQLLRPQTTESLPCGQRIDLQTVQVNHMSACATLNILSWLMLKLPFSACGTFFSTLNSMKPIPIAGVDWVNFRLLPETCYAHVAE